MKKATFGPGGPAGCRRRSGNLGTWRGAAVQAIAALRRGLDAGMTHVDTAEMYGDGRVEEILGEAFADRRDEIFLVSKVLPQNASRRGTVEACDRSLRRLRTGHLDCYLLHWPSSHPLRTRSPLRGAGGGGEDPLLGSEQLRRGAARAAPWPLPAPGRSRAPGALSPPGARHRACDPPLLRRARDRRGGLQPFRPGELSVARKRGGPGAGRGRRGSRRHPSPDRSRLPAAFPRPLRHSQVAKADHAAENDGAAGIQLGEDELRKIDTVFPRGPRRSGVPTL